ncbi:isopentenyl-diphosphate Delta-isomerase [Parafrankia elaeagni]|uniref:isopentenyl-diphosphate Delta-isomerase n=1 Tax=Parafrankia elaeagni TaxID=222534 RepID=UPI000A01E852
MATANHPGPQDMISRPHDSHRSGGAAVKTPELVILLSPSGEVVGTTPKATVHGPQTPLHLAFSSYVFDNLDRLLVTRRALEKRTWPGVLTNTCCGHPAPGEDFREAITRRLQEELGLQAGPIELALPTFRYRCVMDDGTVENEICPVFFTRTSGPFQINPEEVAEAFWLPWSTFVDDVMSGALTISPWARLQVEQLRTLGPSPRNWPSASDDELPAAARQIRTITAE